MTAVVSFDRRQLTPVDPQAPDPAPDPERRRALRRPRDPRDRGRGSLRWAWCPALISVSVNAIFLIAWWAPEFGEFAGRDAILGQLWPLVSAEVTSGGRAVVPAQAGHLGLLAVLMLITSITLPFLARSRSRPVRLIVPTATVYVGAVTWFVTLVQALGGTSPQQAWVGLLLLTAWVATAWITVSRSRFVSVADLPERRLPVGWLVPLFAVLYPLPLALGRALFAPEVGDAARELLASDPTQKFAVLTTPSSLLAYLAGVLVVAGLWAVFELVPPYGRIAVPWVRRRPVTVDPLVARILIAVLCGTTLLLTVFPAAEAGRTQARTWLAGNPTGDHLACATWVQQRPGRPTAFMLSRGDQCRTLVSYAGYTESGSAELEAALSPVKATMPDKRAITTRVVSGQYGAVVVVAGTGAVDQAPDELSGVSMDTAQRLWSFRCDDDKTMRLRFAGADPTPGATKAAGLAAGHVTNADERPSVVVQCTNQALRLDPATGQATN